MPDAPLHAPETPETQGRWFGPKERPLLGWLTMPGGQVTESGVLVLPPVGYPYWSAHRTLRTLAERLATDRHTVLRLDYDGTGDSAGDQWEPDRVAAWRRSAAAGAAELRALGCRRLTVVGARLGGTIALLDGTALGAEAVATWVPVASGRRFIREVKLLAEPVPATEAGVPEGTLTWAGTVFLPETLSDLAALAAGTSVAFAPRSLVVGDASAAAVVDTLSELGRDAEFRVVEGSERALQRPTEEARVPEQVVETIRGWIGPGAPELAPGPEPRTRARLPWAGTELCEEVVELGPSGLVGILTEPAAFAHDGRTLVLLNSGSEPHVGPGRAWVEYARRIAAYGHRAVRVDLRGWGESPDEGHAPGRPYDEHVLGDIEEIVDALRARGHEQVVLLGLCAGAWAALQIARRGGADGVVALNPQLYWQPGDPVEALMSETRERRTPEREREKRGRRFGLWTAADVLGRRPWAARWLDELVDAGVPVSMVFAEGDDGLEFLEDRVGRRFRHARRSGVVHSVEVPEIDHSMHRVWLRERMVETIEAELQRI